MQTINRRSHYHGGSTLDLTKCVPANSLWVGPAAGLTERFLRCLERGSAPEVVHHRGKVGGDICRGSEQVERAPQLARVVPCSRLVKPVWQILAPVTVLQYHAR